MLKIKIADTQFAHGTSLGSGDLKIFPKYFEWYRGEDNINDVIVITESMFHMTDSFTEKIKIAWIIEPASINSDSYKWILKNGYKFDFILTHSKTFMCDICFTWPISANIKLKGVFWYPFGGCWIEPNQRKVYAKTKEISIIASDKNQTEGHKLRHEIIEKLGNKVDVYGRGYKPIDNKLEALRDYQYSIVIENERSMGFFTEKLIDCFMTGTMPIYWGNPTILKDLPNGCTLLECDSAKSIIDTVDLINSHLVITGKNVFNESMQDNYRIGQKFVCPEDWLYENFFMSLPVLKHLPILKKSEWQKGK